MASTSDGLRIGKASLGSVAAVLVTAAGFAASHASQLTQRISGLEAEVATVRTQHDVEQRSTIAALARIESIVEKIRDRQDNR